VADGAGRRGRDLAFAGHGGDDDAPLIPVRVDGKTVRGARKPDGSQVHLLAALAGRPGVVAAQAEVGAKTNEIPMIITLLDGVGLDRAVVTADALHCQRATADCLHGRGADFILPAKDNQPACSMPWTPCPGATSRPPTPPPTAATAGSKPAPSSSWTRPATCRSRTSARHT
jgi:hypothetical protein